MKRMLVLLGGLAVVLAIPAVASSAPLCIDVVGTGIKLEIPLPLFVRGQARAVVGVIHHPTGAATAMSGVTITNANATLMGLSLTGAHVSISSGSASTAPGSGPIVNAVFGVPDHRINVGDGGIGSLDSSVVTFEVVSCATVPDVP